MDDELRQLVGRCLRGDQCAMREFVERYQGRVYGLCFRMLGHRHDAEDAAQETFVRILRHLDRWNPQLDLIPWMLAIAANRCRTALARRSRRPTEQSILESPDSAAADDRRAAQLDEEVQRALGMLRAEHRLAFVLFHEQELSYAEIANCLDRPLGTIKTWIHRARLELIETLQQRDVFEEPRHALR